MWYELIKVEGNKIVLFYNPKVVLNEPVETKPENITQESEPESEPEDEEAELFV